VVNKDNKKISFSNIIYIYIYGYQQEK